ERFFFHLSADSLQAAGAYWPLATAVAALLLAVALAALLLAPPHRRAPRRALLGGLALTACLLLDPALRRTFSAARVAAMAPADIPWQALGLDAAALNPALAGVAEGGRNLVLIYLEGLERVYTEASVFPGLTPNLQRL